MFLLGLLAYPSDDASPLLVIRVLIELVGPLTRYPSLLPGHHPVHRSLGLSLTVLNRARTLRRAISKFPTDKKENQYGLSSLPVPRTPLVDTSSHVSRHSAPRTRKRTRLATSGRTRVIAGRNPDTPTYSVKKSGRRNKGEKRCENDEEHRKHDRRKSPYTQQV